MSASRKLQLLLDADGCIYHQEYTSRLIIFLSNPKTREFLKTHATEVLDENERPILTYLKKQLCSERQFKVDYVNELCEEMLETCKKERPDLLEEHPLTKQSNYNQLALRAYLTIYIDYLNQLDPSILAEFARVTNEALFTYIKSKINEFDILEIKVGSNRTSYGADEYNRRRVGTNSCFVDITYFKNYLESMFPTKKVVMNMAISADYVGGLKEGESYLRLMSDPNHSAHFQGFYDETKLSIIYASAHDSGVNTVFFMDDVVGIIGILHEKLSKFPELIPEGRKVVLHRYDGEINETYEILGTGPLDKNVRNNVMRMYIKCKQENLRFNAARDLDIEDFLKRRSLVRTAVGFNALFPPVQVKATKSNEEVVSKVELKA